MTDDPVLFFEHKALYAAKGEVPLLAADRLEDYMVPSVDKITETVRKSLEG